MTGISKLPITLGHSNVELLIWVIELRDHRSFRAGWVEWARNDPDELTQFWTCPEALYG